MKWRLVCSLLFYLTVFLSLLHRLGSPSFALSSYSSCSTVTCGQWPGKRTPPSCFVQAMAGTVPSCCNSLRGKKSSPVAGRITFRSFLDSHFNLQSQLLQNDTLKHKSCLLPIETVEYPVCVTQCVIATLEGIVEKQNPQNVHISADMRRISHSLTLVSAPKLVIGPALISNVTTCSPDWQLNLINRARLRLMNGPSANEITLPLVRSTWPQRHNCSALKKKNGL